MLNFILLAYLFGPVVAIPYALNALHLTPGWVYVYLSLVYIAPLPIIFWALEYGGHYRKYYAQGIFCKFSKITHKKAADVISFGDEIQEAFEQRLGQLGFYLALSVLTFLVGIFWAVLFAYVLKIKRTGAILFIAIGVVIGDAFWLIVTLNLLPMRTPLEVLSVLLLLFLLAYGRKREMDAIKWVAARVKAKKE
ncbi:MAG: hypothetical protein WAX07_02010 [Candidatus Altiarchaeia archaeon]